MSIAIVIVKDDLISIIPESKNIDDIESDNDFYRLRKIAHDKNMLYVATIDEAGYTVFNSIQSKLLEKELQELRKDPQVNQSILQELQKAIDLAKLHKNRVYIKLIGD